MPLLVPDVGERRLAEMALKDASPEALLLKLYVNDKTPAEGDVASSYVEMSTHGYAAKTLARANWAITTTGGVTTAQQPQQTWTFIAGAAVYVYGYFIVGATTGTLVWAERFGNRQKVESAGDTIKVVVKITWD